MRTRLDLLHSSKGFEGYYTRGLEPGPAVAGWNLISRLSFGLGQIHWPDIFPGKFILGGHDSFSMVHSCLTSLHNPLILDCHQVKLYSASIGQNIYLILIAGKGRESHGRKHNLTPDFDNTLCATC